MKGLKITMKIIPISVLILLTVDLPKTYSFSTSNNKNCIDRTCTAEVVDVEVIRKSNDGAIVGRRRFVETIAAASLTSGILLTTTNTKDGKCNAVEMNESVLKSTKAAAAATTTTTSTSLYDILSTSSKKAVKGGKAGASAAVVQVLALMWLRTIMNYQYRYGGTISGAFSTLYSEGGIARLYQGLPFAIVQGPMTRFGDTAANMGMLALLDTLPQTNSLPLFAKILAGSVAAGGFRIFLMPIDTSKTVLQVEGREGFDRLVLDVQERKTLSPFYRGALATAAATAVGHYPWFLTYNFLDQYLPAVTSKEEVLKLLLRSAFLGICASCTSDTCSNSLRVIKTNKQTAALNNPEKENLSYADTVKLIIEKDGVQGLFGRGLQTRLVTNMIQGALFSVLWKYFQSVQA